MIKRHGNCLQIVTSKPDMQIVKYESNTAKRRLLVQTNLKYHIYCMLNFNKCYRKCANSLEADGLALRCLSFWGRIGLMEEKFSSGESFKNYY